MAIATAPRNSAGLFPLKEGADNRAREISDVVNQLRWDFRRRDELYQDIDDILFGNVPVEIPEAYRKTAIEVRAPLATHIANTVTAALSINPFSIRFRPVGFGDVYQQNATLREHFFESSWERQEEESRRRLLRLFMNSLAVKGEAILKTVERTKRAWSDYNLKSKALYAQLKADKAFDPHAKDLMFHSRTEQMKLAAPYPIATTDVPPETFYYLKGEDGMSFACEVKQMPWFDTLQRFGAGIDRNGKIVSNAAEWLDPHALGLARAEWEQIMSTGHHSHTPTITLIEAWRWDTVTYILVGPGQTASTNYNLGNGTVVRELKHGYGDPFMKTLRGPYFHALGITTASRLPERAGLSILFGFLRMFVLLDSLYTMRANAAFMTGFPAFKRTLPPGTIPGLPGGMGPYGNDGTEAEAQEEIEPGAIYPYDIGPVEMPKAGPEADKLIADIRGMLELALPSIVQGMVAGSESGYALNQAAHLARLAWDPIVSNAEIALGERTGFESWLIEKRIGETVYAWGEQDAKGRKQRGTKAGWLAIGPDDLNGIHRYKAKLDPETPSNKVIEVRALGEQIDRKLITYEDAVEQNGQNPDEVERSWLLQEMKNSDPIKQQLFDTVMQKLGTIRAQRMSAPGMPSPAAMAGGPQAGQPPANPVPMPGQGMPLTPPAPNGPVTGMGPAGLAMRGNPAGTPVVPNVPQTAQALPGQ